MGWNVITLFGCELKNVFVEVMDNIENNLLEIKKIGEVTGNE